MSRGQGLDHTQQYAWIKQPNGRYSIFDIPIFETFNDEKRGTVNAQNLAEIIRNFQEDKLENYRYPRVHIGHHEGNENRQGAGYLDNLRVNGGTVIADLVEVTPEVFQAIKNKMKFPYVSAEYHPEKQKILSLALLESQSPYFSFPLLKLADTQTQVANFGFGFPALILQEQPEDIIQFQDVQAAWAERDQLIRFQENFQGCGCMDKEPEKKDDASTPPNDSKEPMIEEAPKQYKCQDDFVGMGAKLDRLLALTEQNNSMLKEIFQGEQEEHEQMGIDSQLGDKEATAADGVGENLEPSQPMKEEDNPMKKPSSVAFQESMMAAIGSINQAVKGIVSHQAELDKEFAAFRSQQQFAADEKVVQQFCEEQGLDFQDQMKIVKSFSTSKDRKTYMEAMRQRGRPELHPVTLVAQKGTMTEKENILLKFQESDPATRQRANAAHAYWNELMRYGTEKERSSFQCLWTEKPERFVTYCANTPGALEKIKGE